MKRNIYILICLVSILSLFCGCKKENYTITIKYDDEIVQLIENIKPGSIVEKPSINLPEGVKDVEYYYENGETFSFDSVINENLTLNGTYVYYEYTINFYNYDKTLIKSEILPYGSVINYPDTPTREGGEGYSYVFKEWSLSQKTVTRDLDITARYTKVYEEITITALNVDGNIYTTEVCDYGSYINTIKEPEFEKDINKYYRFYGWFNEETNELFDFDEELTKNATIYPKYDIYDYEETTLENAKISFIGDSISTFYSESSEINSLYGGTNQFYYPIYSATVKDVTNTWWYQTYNNLGLTLGVNNSWSGSAAYGSSGSAGMSENRLKTLGDNGTPNIVVIYLGTNDNVNGHTVENLELAYTKMIEYITENYIDFSNNTAKIPYIYLVTNAYTNYNGYYYTEERRLEYNELFNKLANTYSNVRVFDLARYITKDNCSTYLGDSLHYNADGMKLIADKFVEKLKKDFNLSTK